MLPDGFFVFDWSALLEIFKQLQHWSLIGRGSATFGLLISLWLIILSAPGLAKSFSSSVWFRNFVSTLFLFFFSIPLGHYIEGLACNPMVVLIREDWIAGKLRLCGF